MELTEEQKLIRMLTQDLKDIINAADNGRPYASAELSSMFLGSYNLGYAYLEKNGIKEIA